MPETHEEREELRWALANLHDTFLNASMLRSLMMKEPVELGTEDAQDPRAVLGALVSRRFRLERFWVASLAVLVEAWNSEQMASVRAFLANVTTLDELSEVLEEARRVGALDRIIETRHYMFHRDRREYWNDGRTGPVGILSLNDKLHYAFSTVLLAGLDAFKRPVDPAQ